MEPVEVWGCFSAGWKEGLLPLPVSQGLAVLSGVLCHWILGSPQAVSLPGAVWEPAWGSARTQTLRLLVGSVCTGSSGFNPVKPSNFPWEHVLFYKLIFCGCFHATIAE